MWTSLSMFWFSFRVPSFRLSLFFFSSIPPSFPFSLPSFWHYLHGKEKNIYFFPKMNSICIYLIVGHRFNKTVHFHLVWTPLCEGQWKMQTLLSSLDCRLHRFCSLLHSQYSQLCLETGTWKHSERGGRKVGGKMLLGHWSQDGLQWALTLTVITSNGLHAHGADHTHTFSLHSIPWYSTTAQIYVMYWGSWVGTGEQVGVVVFYVHFSFGNAAHWRDVLQSQNLTKKN